MLIRAQEYLQDKTKAGQRGHRYDHRSLAKRALLLSAKQKQVYRLLGCLRQKDVCMDGKPLAGAAGWQWRTACQWQER